MISITLNIDFFKVELMKAQFSEASINNFHIVFLRNTPLV